MCGDRWGNLNEDIYFVLLRNIAQGTAGHYHFSANQVRGPILACSAAQALWCLRPLLSIPRDSTVIPENAPTTLWCLGWN